MVSKLYLGRRRDDQEFVDYAAALGKSGPAIGGRLELNCFNSVLMRDAGNPAWERWNLRLRDYLIRVQETEGDSAGSWFLPDSGWSTTNGGRLFCTALAALVLEVYYRHPPRYE